MRDEHIREKMSLLDVLPGDTRDVFYLFTSHPREGHIYIA